MTAAGMAVAELYEYALTSKTSGWAWVLIILILKSSIDTDYNRQHSRLPRYPVPLTGTLRECLLQMSGRSSVPEPQVNGGRSRAPPQTETLNARSDHGMGARPILLHSGAMNEAWLVPASVRGSASLPSFCPSCKAVVPSSRTHQSRCRVRLTRRNDAASLEPEEHGQSASQPV
ncbi:hypothetical protein LY76DRAFT_345705 [Colletotrichum caudatum]|nr:hypothetical protein LY76DRAFT_345705 [Colletotrichum caudatum]